MNNQEFMTQIDQDQLRPEEVPVTNLTESAYAIRVNGVPHREALISLKHLLLEEDEHVEGERPLVFKVEGQPAQLIGRIYLTLDAYKRIERILNMYQAEIHELSETGEWCGIVPKASLVHTIKLKGSSIFEHI